jgi:hypothetical protein
MALSKLKTDWKTIGASGLTVDGRTISPAALESAAETYDPEFYAALMFPDHDRYFSPNFGKIEELRTVKNDDGSVSLQAIIAPNENYIYANRQGQYLYSSMELRADFPERGRYYLIGCAPTDNPASTRTAEIRFSAHQHQAQAPAPGNVMVCDPVEMTLGDLQNSETGGFFARLFARHNSEDDMNPKQLDTLLARLDAIDARLTAAPTPAPAPAPAEPDEGEGDEASGNLALSIDRIKPFAGLAELSARVDGLAGDVAGLAELKTQIAALREDFAAALIAPDPNATKPPTQQPAGGSRAFL